MKLRVVIGAALLCAGAGTIGFAAYNTWGVDAIDQGRQTQIANQYQPAPQQSASSETKKFIDPAKATHLADIFGKIYIPRLGTGWNRLVAEGTKWHPVLNDIGIGHYTNSQMPGEVGNFAVAAHRGGFGGAFKNIHRLVAGDHVYVLTNDAWYSYAYMQTKIVKPNDLDVITKVPSELHGAVQGGRYMTLTSCNPIFVNTTRIIVWLKLDETRTIAQGPPAQIASLFEK